MPSDPPGTTKPRRFVPRLHYELLVCGVRGHELLGLDVAHVRPEDAIVMRPGNEGMRWHRCVRCDSWLALPAPASPTRDALPPREAIVVPLRGKALRDKIVLRVIAVDRAFHFVLLSVIAAAIFLFAANEASLRDPAYKVLADLQGAFNGSSAPRDHGVLHDVRRLFSISHGTLTKIGLLVTAYALLEGAEAIGLWLGKRWAEYLTFIATAGLMPLEIWELSNRVSVLKILTLLINLAIVVYLLYAKRLFGIRGGGAAEAAERERDVGWQALERATPA